MTQVNELREMSLWRTALLLAVTMAVIVTALGVAWWLWTGEPASRDELARFLIKGLLCWALACTVSWLAWQVVRRGIAALIAQTLPAPANTRAPRRKDEAVRYLRKHHGRFWRRKVRLYLVLGEAPQVESFAPSLQDKTWLSSDGTVLLWGGSLHNAVDQALIGRWARVQRGRGIDGVIWVLDKTQRNDSAMLGTGLRRLRSLAGMLGWQLRLHLWEVGQSEWLQHGRTVQPVGCIFPERSSETVLASSLEQLQQRLREQGLAQISQTRGHDFLLRLCAELRSAGTAPWQALLAGTADKCGVSLRGLWFSLPLQRAQVQDAPWVPGPAWPNALIEATDRPRRLGWSIPRLAPAAALTVLALWGAGLLLSYASNQLEITRLQHALTTLQQAPEGSDPTTSLGELTRDLSRLAYRAEHGAPWYQRFGLDHSQALRDTAWPFYVQANQRLLRDPAVVRLSEQLRALVSLPPGSAERAGSAKSAYAALKAYLMLARPEKAEADFLVRTLGGDEPAMWAFYAQHLPSHPEWRIEADAKLVAQVRQVLLGELGQRNAEASLYQQALATAANHYPALGLQQLVGETEAQALFSTQASVPGVYTRQAWEGHVRAAIEDAGKTRREEIDWVLSDSPADLATELSPEQLQARLTARYFEDYRRAWLDFLNSLRWQQRDGLDEVIAQLTLMSDVRQSPLIALMNTLAYQGQAGARGQALAESLLKSAQQLIGQEQAPLIEQLPVGMGGPLEDTFGPLLTLLGKGPDTQRSADSLSLQTFLTRVTGVRLKLQQVTNAADPQAMTQALAQTVFQGKQVDLTDTRAYGSRIAASLGGEWAGAAQTLFVQPLEQAWQRVLQPSAAGLNRDWQRAIVSDWNAAFSGRYPFAATSSDASLPMLGQMIRAGSGRIEQFLHEQLGGLLRKQGSRWVAEPGQGLRLNPQFLAAINRLSRLADVLYTDGGMGLGFELRGTAVRDVVQTRFVLDGQAHHYFNQRERWQRFRWPGQGEQPGTSLTWTSVHTGERLFADLAGNWGLIRLLEQAQVTPLDDRDSHYRVVLKAPDGIGLTWHLRTELGAGPLALLELRDFSLPSEIFLVEGQRHEQPGGV